jgi:hypothetical protein
MATGRAAAAGGCVVGESTVDECVSGECAGGGLTRPRGSATNSTTPAATAAAPDAIGTHPGSLRGIFDTIRDALLGTPFARPSKQLPHRSMHRTRC